MITVTNICETKYRNLTKLDDVLYCENSYNRDRSSFGGIAFNFRKDNNIFLENCVETMLEKRNRYEEIYMGMDSLYSETILDVFQSAKVTRGLNIIFLVYSNIRSSQIIFRELIQWMVQNV